MPSTSFFALLANFAISCFAYLPVQFMRLPHPLLDSKRNLIEQLRVLAIPNACVFRLKLWIQQVHVTHKMLKDGHIFNTTLKNYVRDMFNVTWAWVTRPRTHDEMHAVISMRCTCSPEGQLASGHQSGQEICAAGQISPGLQIIADCLYPGAVADPQDETPLNKLHRRKDWPQSVKSFIPHGAARTIDGVCQWLKCGCKDFDRAQIFRCLTRMTSLIRPLFIVHIIFNRAYLDGIYNMEQAVRSYHAQWTTSSRKEQDEELIELAYTCCTIVETVGNLVGASWNEIQRRLFHADAPARLLRTYESVNFIMHDAADLMRKRRVASMQRRFKRATLTIALLTTAQGWLSDMAPRLYFDCHYAKLDVFDLSKQTHLELVGSNTTVPAPSSMGGPRLVAALAYIKKSPHCCAPSCCKTLADGPLMGCKGCAFSVLYCSRQCQKRAWNDSRVGHRTWCADLSRIVNLAMVDREGKLAEWDSLVWARLQCDHKKLLLHIMDNITALSMMQLQALNLGVDLRVE
jgi:hypothetical protein